MILVGFSACLILSTLSGCERKSHRTSDKILWHQPRSMRQCAKFLTQRRQVFSCLDTCSGHVKSFWFSLVVWDAEWSSIYIYVNIYLSIYMDGWMDGWLDGWMDGWLDGWMAGWMDGWAGWLDGWDGWMAGWLGNRILVIMTFFCSFECSSMPIPGCKKSSAHVKIEPTALFRS